jgi:hypothetical protein
VKYKNVMISIYAEVTTIDGRECVTKFNVNGYHVYPKQFKISKEEYEYYTYANRNLKYVDFVYVNEESYKKIMELSCN